MTDITRLQSIMVALRDPVNGCPWDVEQDFDSIAPYTIEEAYEVADAIAEGDLPALQDELGDLLFQVVFHAQMAHEQQAFSLEDVHQSICEKMERRHPHVFGDAQVADAEAQTQAWEQHKAKERAKNPDKSALAGVARGLPEWARAMKLQKKARRVGFDWDNLDDVTAKVREELAETEQALAARDADAVEAELGDLLFAVVNLCRHVKVDPGAALRRTNRSFEQRFRFMETLMSEDGCAPSADMPLDEMDQYWEKAKKVLADNGSD